MRFLPNIVINPIALPLQACHGGLVKRAYCACSKLTGVYGRAQDSEAALGAQNPLCFVQFVAPRWPAVGDGRGDGGESCVEVAYLPVGS